jgi:hypothetical protein
MASNHPTPCPPVRLDHLHRMTDSTGIIQHGYHAVPDPTFGYSIDDQARALIVVLQHARLAGLPDTPRAAFTYLSYLRYAAQPDGTFHNFLSYDRRWLDERVSEDAQGRTLWSLAYAARFGREQALTRAAEALFTHGLQRVPLFTAPRGWAFALVALYHRLQIQPDTALVNLVHELAGRLIARFDATADAGWRWFEDTLTYCNGKLPLALLLAHVITGEARYLAVALDSLNWLSSVLFDTHGTLRLVGQNGWYPRGGTKAPFDEQCVDAQGTVEVALAAYRLTGDATWRQRALSAFTWFLGRNVHGLPLIDPQTWGCYDGITPTGLNLNMGAESIVCYLLAYLDLVEAGLLTLDGGSLP